MDDASRESDRLASEWAQEHFDLLSRCFECFQSTARWPTLEQLQVDFALGDQEAEVGELARSMPPLLGVVEEGRLGLNVRGMSEVPASLPLLEIWASLLRSACAKELRREITSAEVWAACAGDPIRASCLTSILFRETWPPHSGEGKSGNRWWIFIDDAVEGICETRTLADLLEVRGLVPSRPQPPLMEELARLSERLDDMMGR